MENYGYEPISSQSLTSQSLLMIKYFENESCIFSMFVSQDRHNFVLILVDLFQENVNMLFHFKILFQLNYEILHIWDHLQNCYILKIKLLCLWEYEKNCYFLKLKLLHLCEYLKNYHFFTESAEFPGKSTNLLLQYKLCRKLN